MVGWHHQLNGPEVEQTPGDGEGQGQGRLECYGSGGHKGLGTAQGLNNNSYFAVQLISFMTKYVFQPFTVYTKLSVTKTSLQIENFTSHCRT